MVRPVPSTHETPGRRLRALAVRGRWPGQAFINSSQPPAMATDPRVLAPPLLPLGIAERQKRFIDCEPATFDAVASRCAGEGPRVIGLRFSAGVRAR